MFVMFAVMSMTLQWEIPITELLPEQHSKTFPKIGYAPFAECTRMNSAQWIEPDVY